MKVGDLVRHTQQNFVGLLVEKIKRNPAWSVDMWHVLYKGELVKGTDLNLEVVNESR